MDISIHQPQYLPWVPYFRKIEQSDLFIFLDNVDFQKNGLQNRNQIKTDQGRKWLTVPVRQHLGQKISEVVIDNGSQWKRKHFERIYYSYKKTAAFATYESEFNEVFSKDWIELSKLNISLVELMLRLLEIETPILKSSQMQAVGKSSDLILNLCKEAGASRYISGTGGMGYLEEAKFKDAGIKIVYQPPILPSKHPQVFPEVEFMNDLSALDILFNCGSSWRDYLPKGSWI